MASLRAGPRRQELLGQETQAKRSGAYMETPPGDVSSLSRRQRKAAEFARLAAVEPPPRTSSKIPQTSSRHAPFQSYAWKQKLAQGHRAANSNVSDVSGNTSNSTASTSTAPTSRSQDSSKQPRNVLRRKQPAVAEQAAGKQYHSRDCSLRSDSAASAPRSQASMDVSRDGYVDTGLADDPASPRLAQQMELPNADAQAVTVYPELDRYRNFQPQTTVSNHYFEVPYPITTDLPPPTPLFSSTSSQHSAFSGSPSTRFSESPGPGPYSRDTTPTSMSSVSPGLVAPMRLPVSRPKQNSPAETRPPVTRRRAGSASHETRDASIEREGLTAVRESSNSSSSGSTVRPPAFGDQRKKNHLPLSPPVQPPRMSLEHFNKDREAEEALSKAPSVPATSVAAASYYKPDIISRPSRDTDSPLSRATPPSRPSREGTTDLQSQIGLPVPVVHSNLSATSLSERRRSGQNPMAALSRTNTPLQTDHNRQQSVSRIGREPTPAPHAPAPGPDPQMAKQPSRGTARTPSPSVSSTFKTRFPLFGRRNKTAAPAEKKEKPPRKGPAAGTGHEGYGRLGHVRRRSSNLTNAIRAVPGTVSSQETLAGPQVSDPFLAERMSPVVISGGEIIQNRNVSSDLNRTESNQSMTLPRPSIGDSRNNSQASLSSLEARNTLWPSALPRGATPNASQGHRRLPSDSSDSDVLTMKPTLAVRRSMQRLKTSDPANARVPKPITVLPGGVTPSINSYDTTLLSDDSTFSLRPPMGRTDSESSAPKKLTKRPKSPRKWNIFGRSTTQSSTKKKQSEAAQVSATVKVVQKQPMAFYTMMDNPEQEEQEFADVEDVLREAQILRPPSPTPVAPSGGLRRPSVPQNQAQGPQRAPANKPEQNKTLQPPKRIATVASSRNLRNPTSQPSRVQPPRTASKPPSAGRPSRLPQIGRIPKVAGRSEPPPPSPSARSFSRPFNRASMQLGSQVDLQKPADEFVAKGPSPPESSSSGQEVSQTRPEDSTHDQNSAESAAESAPFPASRDPKPEASHAQREFMIIPPRPPRGDSQGTSTTDSSCSDKLSYSEATAVIPEPNAPLAEDEIWDEYNDLLGDDVSRGHPSVSSSLGRPFHLEVWGRHLGKGVGQPLETPIINGNMGAQMNAHIEAVESDCETEFEVDAQDEVHEEHAPTASSLYSSDMTAKFNEVLEAAGAPKSSPFSLSEFVSGYGSRTNSTEVSRPPSHRRSTVSSQREIVLRDSHTSSSSQGSNDNSTVAQVNLRVGSMTVSKWLTFGHVLFSPVRDELIPVVGSLKRHSILVIDGLGNDDWSFYASETYPAATFFNLSPRAPLPTPEQNPGASFPLSPPNHHQIQYKSNADKLPFGPQSFTCVVFRFPAAAPESHYRNVINEARRVLKPGGYIELSILDVDMNSMGNHARRAVRRLKERIHTRAPSISLGSSSDLILRLLGRKGFTDIKTCRVGVPLASATAASPTDQACSSSSSAASSSRAAASASTRRRSKKETRSLAEMMSAEGPGADEGITKMVAKVGRWWYERCYESVIREGKGKSMWADQALLAECEEWQTSLKLMVCHARIPDGRNRVASI